LDDLVRRHWFIDLADVDWLSPAIAPMLVDLLPPSPTVLTIADDGGAPHLLLGVPDAGAPIDLGTIDLTRNPSFRVGPSHVRGDIQLHDTIIEGSFTEGGATIEDLTATATFDTRELQLLLPRVELCDVSEALGEPCEPCPDGERTCLTGAVRIAATRH
jgi:hypothetical protein